ncbi:unnamed protein product, partial [Vitis vinifera]|uniref:Uncharacterized protein n=1 Tax=Vitis vinifera TaxID=29760 RepID=D7SMA6_VITVI
MHSSCLAAAVIFNILYGSLICCFRQLNSRISQEISAS